MFDSASGMNKISTNHKARSLNDDLHVLKDHLRELRPFSVVVGRQLMSHPGRNKNPLKGLNHYKFKVDILRTAERLSRGVHVEVFDNQDDDDHDDDDNVGADYEEGYENDNNAAFE